MQKNKFSIRIETRNTYYDNIDTGESIYSFLSRSKLYEKLMPKELQFFDNYKDYIMNYLTKIESQSDDALDVLTHKNTKFLFY